MHQYIHPADRGPPTAVLGSPYVNCGHSFCCGSTQLNVGALADRLGADHGALHDDLVKLFRCQACNNGRSIPGRQSDRTSG